MRAMPRPRPPHLARQTTRHGKTVWYVRVGKGPRIRIRAAFGTPEFAPEYRAAVDGVAPAQKRVGAAEGSFAWGLKLYRQSQPWAALSVATRRQREAILRKIEASSHGKSKLAAWRRGDVMKGRDARADRPAAARHFVETLRHFFQWAVKAEIVRADPTQGVDVVKIEGDGFAPWSDDEIARFRQRWPLGARERLAFELLRGAGLRRGDAVRVGRPHVKDGIIRLNTEKTGERVAIAMPDELVAAIAAGPCGELTFIAGERGAPMTKESFGNWFREACNAAGVKKSAHGLRKSAAMADALDGWTDAELDAKFGWQGRRMASLYTKAANRERLSLAAAKRTKSRTSIPSPIGEGEGAAAEKPIKSTAEK